MTLGFSPTKEYFERTELMTAALNSIKLPRKITWKYELSPGTENQIQSTLTAEDKAKGRRVDTKMMSGDVVNFYRDGSIIGRVYFLEDPVKLESYDAAFSRIDIKLRKKLGL